MGISDVLTCVWQAGPVLGPAIAVMVFFLWKDWRRETHLQDRVEKLEAGQKDMIFPLVEKCTSVIAANTVVMTANTAVMTRLESLMDRMLFAQGHSERCLLDRLLQDAAEHRQA